jgi:hypothetical protein
MGTRPAGHSGQFGQLNPTPDALTYPPINIREKRTTSVITERRVKSITSITENLLN